jgi:hypothetical protein
MTYSMNKVFIQNKKGQAILELAIFGSILITLLGILISYGLKYNYQQLAAQRAFRRALGTAATSMETGTPVSVSHTLIEDHHIPDPTHQFALGSVTPFSATASVTRSASLHETPDRDSELPVAQYNISGQTFTFKTAGFREETNIRESRISRYELIYSAVQAWNTTTGSWVYWEDGTKTCIAWGTGPLGVPICTAYSIDRVKYMDDCAGELMSYDETKKQCRKIIDSAVCERYCRRGSGTDCVTTCSQPMPVPWYCGTDYVETDAFRHIYTFPFLDTLFAFAKGKDKAMGLQTESYLQEGNTSATLFRTDNTAQAETRDVVTFNTHTEREIVSKTYGDTTTNTNTQIVATDTQRDTNRIWRTPWD